MKNMEFLSKAINKVGFKIKKYSPEILVGVGIIGVVASTVTACVATTKISEILAEAKYNLDEIHNCIGDESLTDTYSEVDEKKDLVITYVQTGVKLVRIYAPAIALGGLSLSCILASNNVLRKRHIALAAAYATIDKGFKEYRERVVSRFGEEIDHELKYNVKTKKVDKIVIDENGKEKRTKETISVVGNPNLYSEYARFFDDGCIGWEKDSEYNLMFLRGQQNYANNKLQSRGYLFLNEVYDMLGIPQTKAGQVVGWKCDTNDSMSDGYVDFGMYDVHKETVRNFVNGIERTILLDFNVDGNIWDLM